MITGLITIKGNKIMSSRDFCYWMMGFFEISDAKELTTPQVEMIKRHLALVFKYEIDPSYGDKEHQEKLNEIHSGENKLPPLHPSKNTVYRC